MPPFTFATMPLEIYGYTVLSIKTVLLCDNVLFNNVQKQNVAYSYTLSRKNACMPHSGFVQ